MDAHSGVEIKVQHPATTLRQSDGQVHREKGLSLPTLSSHGDNEGTGHQFPVDL
jgi:hypothetical protein